MITMTSNTNLGAADVSDGVILASRNADPMDMVEQLPEVSVPIDSLTPWFYLRQYGTDASHVRLLADAATSAKLPSILVLKRDLRIIDGMHRVEAAKLRGERSISARVVDCTDEEALVLAVKSNTLHGLPLTRADRISSAKRILCTHPDWSDRALAGITGLSAKSIASIRSSATADAQFNGKRLGRDGKRRPVTSGDGRRRAAEYIAAHPGASLREVARETDISLGTVHDVRERLRRGADPAPQPVRQPARPAVEQVRHAPSRQTATAAGPPASVSTLRPVRARLVPKGDWQAMSGRLARDPALRYTDGGRAFLRWMAAHAGQADEWQEFVDAIPEHWLADVGQIAAAMSEEWRLFAERLKNRRNAAI